MDFLIFPMEIYPFAQEMDQQKKLKLPLTFTTSKVKIRHWTDINHLHMCCTDVFSTLSTSMRVKKYNNNECDPYANECVVVVSLIPSFLIPIQVTLVWFYACAVYDTQVLNSCYVCEVPNSKLHFSLGWISYRIGWVELLTYRMVDYCSSLKRLWWSCFVQSLQFRNKMHLRVK